MIKRRLAEHIRRRERRHRDRGRIQTRLTENSSDCLFVFETESASKQYRVDHACLILERMGLKCIQISLQELDTIERYNWLERVRLVVLHRLPSTLSVKHLINGCIRWKVPLVLDLDDAIDDVTVYRQSAIYDHLNRLEKRIHDDLSRRVAESLKAADAVSVSTRPLADRIAATGKPVICIPNRISPIMISSADPDSGEHRMPRSLGYMSGTSTHHRDFGTIASAVRRIMQQHTDVRLVIAGPLELPDSIDTRFQDRILRLPLKNWPDFLPYYRRVAVNLAPLETNNPFCRAKSGIKFLEAALSSTPTIAPPSPDFLRVITHESTGFIASSEDQWFQTIQQCLTNPLNATEIGENARKYVIQNENIEVNIPIWRDLLSRLGVWP